MSIWPCVLAHCNVVKHALGWLEGGLCTSYEKIILDAEMLQLIAATLEPLDTGEDALGIEAMREVGPGSHFFQAAHTMARYESAFYAPMLSDWRNFETWQEGGAIDATRRANRLWQELLAAYEPPPMDPAAGEDALGIDAIREVGPGSHFFQAAHTMARYESAFYAPLLSDWRNFETWQESGAVGATWRAHRLWQELLAAYEPPPLKPAVAEEIAAFVARRKEEGGAPTN